MSDNLEPGTPATEEFWRDIGRGEHTLDTSPETLAALNAAVHEETLTHADQLSAQTISGLDVEAMRASAVAQARAAVEDAHAGAERDSRLPGAKLEEALIRQELNEGQDSPEGGAH